MKIDKIISQVRRDLKGDAIPDAILNHKIVRSKIAALIGKSLEDQKEQYNARIAEILSREKSESLAETRKRIETEISIKSGYFRTPGKMKQKSLIVQELYVGPDRLFVHAFATSDECLMILEKTVKILKDAGVTKSCLEDFDDNFMTDTSVQFDAPLDKLLSDKLQSFLVHDLSEASHRDSKTTVIIHPYSISCRIHQWQTDASRPSDVNPKGWDFIIGHRTFEDHNKNILTINSRFDFATHKKLLMALNKCFSET